MEEWIRRLTGLTIEEFCIGIGKGLPGRTSIFSFSFSGFDGAKIEAGYKLGNGTPVWSVTVDFRPDINTAFLAKIFVSQASQDQGHSLKILRNLIASCEHFDIHFIESFFQGIGAYLGVGCGFIPDKPSWERLRSSIARRADELQRAFGPLLELELIRDALRDPDPRAIRILALLDSPVTIQVGSTESIRGTMPLGRAVLEFKGSGWDGLLDLRDEESLNILNAWIEKYEYGAAS